MEGTPIMEATVKANMELILPPTTYLTTAPPRLKLVAMFLLRTCTQMLDLVLALPAHSTILTPTIGLHHRQEMHTIEGETYSLFTINICPSYFIPYFHNF